MGRPFPVLVPLPEVRNPISGTAFTVFFLARVHVQSRKSLGKWIDLRPPTGMLESRRREEEAPPPLVPPAGCRDASRHAAATSHPLGALSPLVH